MAKYPKIMQVSLNRKGTREQILGTKSIWDSVVYVINKYDCEGLHQLNTVNLLVLYFHGDFQQISFRTSWKASARPQLIKTEIN